MSGEFRYLVLTFPTTHAVLAGERALLGLGLDPELIPVPSQIDSSCGFCLRLGVPADPAGRERLLNDAESLDHEALWKIIEGASWKERTYERIDETDRRAGPGLP